MLLVLTLLLLVALVVVQMRKNTPEAKFERNLKAVLTAYFTFPWDMEGLEVEADPAGPSSRPYTRAFLQRACGDRLTEAGFKSLE